VSIAAVVLACTTWIARPAGQEPSTGTGPTQIVADPIRCWWKTDKSAVHIAEQFTLVLTCAVIETRRVNVVPDLNRLDPAALQLAPYEVVSGTRHKDIQAAPWRYLQYSYTVRVIGDEFFGHDVDIPSLRVMYNVQSADNGGTKGRDQVYVLKALPIRVLSLVPSGASDILDASPETFADIEGRLFRATEAMAAGGILLSFAALLAGLTIARGVRHKRARIPVTARPLPAAAVLQACVGGNDRLQSEATGGGWTPERIGRALTAFRIAGAVALDEPVAQEEAGAQLPEREGQMALRQGILKSKRMLISAPTTEAAIGRRLASGNGGAPDDRIRPILEDIRGSLSVFAVARYSRNGQLDSEALDTALDRGTRAIRRLWVTKRWPARALEAVASVAVRLRGAAAWGR
jgi:hypothetical protein